MRRDVSNIVLYQTFWYTGLQVLQLKLAKLRYLCITQKQDHAKINISLISSAHTGEILPNRFLRHCNKRTVLCTFCKFLEVLNAGLDEWKLYICVA